MKEVFFAKIRGKEQGIVLVTTLLLLSVITIFGTAAVLQGATDLRISRNYWTAVQARYAAEAGAGVAAAVFLRNPGAFSQKGTAADLGLPQAKPAKPNLGEDAAYWFSSITYDPATSPEWVDIRCRGSVLKTENLGDITVRLGAAYSGRFDCAAFGEEGVRLDGQAYTDSYLSDLSPWSVQGGRRGGDIGTNGIRPGAIAVKGQATVYGSATIGAKGYTDEGISISKGAGGITGKRRVAVARKNMAPVSLPEGGDFLDLSGSPAVSAGTYRFSGLNLDSETSVRIGGNVVFLIDGALRTGGRGEIRVSPGSSLTLYVSGDVCLAGGGIVNETGIPANVRIYGTRTCREVVLAGRQTLYAAVYTPGANIRFSGGVDLFGAVAGRSVDLGQGGCVHYDEALRNVDGGTTLSRLRVLWVRDNPV